jgi:hypothetical protein
MTDNQEIPVVQAGPSGSMLPHRGTTILVLGILGLVCCFICGIIAWVMGNTDIKSMNSGMMDPSGRGLTQAGKICGIISVVLAIVGIVIWLLAAVLGGAASMSHM